MENIRYMLSQAKLPKRFWDEALMTVVDVINISPYTALDYDVAEHVWSGKDVSYMHLRVFGCRAFAHIPNNERSKLDGKTKECIFLGYSHDQFGYRLWDPEKQKVFRSRDVVFFEDQTIENLKEAPTKTSAEGFVDCDPVIPPVYHGDGGDVQEDGAEPNVDLPAGHVEQEEEREQVPTEPQLRRSSRPRQPSRRYSTDEYVMFTNAGEPESYHEAVESEQKKKWFIAMQEEMDSLQKNYTYDLVQLREGSYGQKKCIDFEEIFSPVKMSSICVALGIAANIDLEIEQLDVKIALLHGDLEEKIYMKQPEGFKVKGNKNLVCKLKKSLYGLKQAPRQWYKKFDSFIIENEYKRIASYHCVYIKRFGENFIILLLYVDDMLILRKDMSMIDKLKKDLSKSFAMKDIGPTKFRMSNAKRVGSSLADHFKLCSDQSPSSDEEKEKMQKVPYVSAVGSLIYAMVCTRPDIAYTVGVISRFIANPGKEYCAAMKWIFRYLRGSSKVCLSFGDGPLVLIGYTDANMTRDIDTRKSTSGFVLTFIGGVVS
ncbi:hypothetical protein OPV22_030575 [Ensete ventricosum]|uniref:Reverse transcriptase Ty1/copia-type domain-containing protein n=1 Tax=Ensete ventricosum TaxID=4639 RepID=A0AAV8Q4I2_ENSVE|nr:hypothetical protein OPV22_030575 [Ensete ventricosum]